MDAPADTTQEDQEAKITSYEEALAKIKDSTGVSDIQEVVDRFLNQGKTQRHLEQLKEENTRALARLREEKERLQAQFEDMKYSGEAKMSAYVDSQTVPYTIINITVHYVISLQRTQCDSVFSLQWSKNVGGV